jgi:O-antigen/teichoic acid export membrane protein
VSATRAAPASGYGRGARLLSVGLGSTGLVTFAYFSVAAHVLDGVAYKQITLLWAVMFVVISVLYKPIEQLLSLTLADRRARGLSDDHPLRTPLVLQAGFAALFLVVALALRGPVRDGLFDGSATLYWVLVAGVLCYSASYFARGWLAGHQWFALYGGLVFMEASSRLLFALAVAIGIAEGQSAVAIGMAAAPLVSLVVVPLAFARRPQAGARRGEEEELALGRGGRFALAVLVIMLAEQTLINAAVLTTELTAPGAAAAGFVFNVLLIARAPLQLFQAVQGALLPHLAGLEATAGRAEARRAVRVTVLAIAGFALAVAAGLLALGPWAMELLFGDESARYARGGLALVALGMGCHLMAATLNQAALARDHAGRAALAWLLAGAAFVAWLVSPVVEDALLRAETGYLGATALLCAMLVPAYRRG